MPAWTSIREEEKTFLPGPGPAAVFTARQRSGKAARKAKNSPLDREWMPRLVLMAKTVYVWLDQLGKKYGRPIATLEQIPDEELDTAGSLGLHRALADRRLGAQPGLAAHQAEMRQPRGPGLGLFPVPL